MTTSSRVPPHRPLPAGSWPDPDRRLWEAAQASNRVTRLYPKTVRKIAEGYGLWLDALGSRNALRDADRPSERATPESVAAYEGILTGRGCMKKTIIRRMWDLRAALTIMEPDLNPSWITIRHGRGGRRSAFPTATAGWPEIDRQLWESGIRPGDFINGPNQAQHLRPATLQGYVERYRAWLAFLQSRGLLDRQAMPAERVSRENVWAYFRSRCEAGNASKTITGSLADLRAALRIMQPAENFRWLTTPGGHALTSYLPVHYPKIQAIDSDVLYGWGHTVMQEGLDNPSSRRRSLTFRNGLLIAILAARGPRLRSIAALRIGKNIIPHEDGYRLIFEEEDIKTGRALEYDTPAGLSTAITRYLNVERPELLSGQDHDWFWINGCGQGMTVHAINAVIHSLSKQRFGIGFGPHRFRHGIGTTGPLKDPEYPGVAAAILGITGRMVEKHYNRADKAKAATRFHAGLREDRKRSLSLARRAFSKSRRKQAP